MSHFSFFVSMCFCLSKKLHYLFCNQILNIPVILYLPIYIDFSFHMLFVPFLSFCYSPIVPYSQHSLQNLPQDYPESNISTSHSSSSISTEIQIKIGCMKYSITAKNSKSLSKVLKYIIIFKLLENSPAFSESIIGLLNIN